MRSCPTCGWLVVDPSATACPHCGAALSAPAPQPEQAAPTAPAAGAYLPQQTPYPGAQTPDDGHPLPQPVYPYEGYSPRSAPPSRPVYLYPPQPTPPSQPVYPYGYGGYPQGAPVPPGTSASPYAQAPGANWRPGQQRGPRSQALLIALVIALVVVVLGGVGYGVYALSAKASPNANQPAGTPTVTVPANALLNDPLTSNAYGWSSGNTHCYFDRDGYHVSNSQAQSGYTGWLCNAPIGAVPDGSVSVTAEQIAGSTLQPYGITFRYNKPDTHYWFAIDSDSKWALFRIENGNVDRLSDYTYNAAIHGGFNVKNTLTVAFRGQRITCMINGVSVGALTDTGSSLGAGIVALEVGENLNVVFTNFLALP